MKLQQTKTDRLPSPALMTNDQPVTPLIQKNPIPLDRHRVHKTATLLQKRIKMPLGHSTAKH